MPTEKATKRVLADTQTNARRQKPVNWDDFRVFLAVARAGSFHRAADELSTTQATISRRLENLERAIGTKLFDRGRHGAVLTFEGRRVLNEANAAELCLTRATRSQGGPAEVEGECKLLSTEGLASYWLPMFLPVFASRYGGVQLKFFVTLDPARSQRPPYDLQIQYVAGHEADTIPIRLGTLHFTFFASREYLATHGTPSKVGDLAHHQLLKFSSILSDEAGWSEYSIEQAEFRSSFFTNSSASLAELVRRGMGISLLPSYTVLINPDFVPLVPDYHLKTAIFLNYRRDIGKRPAVRAAIDFLKDVAFNRKDMPWFRDAFEAPSAEWNAILRSFTNGHALRPAA